MNVNGVRLFVRRFGDPGLPPLIVVHGGPTWDHSYLLPAVAELADVAHVVLFDLRGCGRSERIPPHGDLAEDQLQPEFLADDVAGLIRELGHPDADVLGFSFGGRIAMRVVERHPRVVRRLILASTTAYTDFEPATVDEEVDYAAADGPDGELSRAMAEAGIPSQIWRLDRREEWRGVLDRVRFSSDYNRLYATGELRPGAPDNAAEVLRAWGGPTLILHGARDLCFPIEVARRLNAELPASSLIEVPEAGHMAHFDNPEAWLAGIRQAISAASPATTNRP